MLRPPHLRRVFDEIYGAHSTPSVEVLSDEERDKLVELHRLADDMTQGLIDRQIEAGLDVVTDGELRRAMFTGSVVDALRGGREKPHDIEFVNDGGADDPVPSDPKFVRRLERTEGPVLREIEAIRAATDHPFKVTFPAASYWYYPSSSYDEGVYGSRDELVDDVVRVTSELLAEAVAAGADYVQLDFPLYPMFGDRSKCDGMLRELGETEEALLAKALSADNRVIEGLPPDVTRAMHICRGNYRSQWWLDGSLEPAAEALFNELEYDRFLIEWDDVGREGDYTPLRHVPAGPVVVVGLISTKSAQVEDDTEVIGRLEEAARYLDLGQLALSPQCGFASTWHGNKITEEVQWRKLDLVGRVAERTWG